MQVAGYIASLFIGVSLGLIGGGGSILTMPVLVYLFRINPVLSTSYSLFIVGSTSLVGAVNSYRKNGVHVKLAFLFGASSITTVFLTRKFVIPFIPENLFTIGHIMVTHSFITLILFAGLMIIAARAMIKNRPNENENSSSVPKTSSLKLASYSILVGLATGVLGAGGGFLLIPTLVLLVGLPMKEAIGTSLFIVALNSLVGFAGDIGHFNIDWLFLLKITAMAMGGIFLGGMLGKKINGAKLKKGFGWFVLVMGISIILTEFVLTVSHTQ